MLLGFGFPLPHSLLFRRLSSIMRSFLARLACTNPSFLRSKPPLQTPWSRLSSARESTSSPPLQPTERVSAIVDEISGLTHIELMDLAEVVNTRLGEKEIPFMAVMGPGFGGGLRGKGGGGGGAAKGAEEKKEKTAFDLKLESFDAASKIKIIKEVRSFTDLGLKEAKDLVEKAPALLKKGVTKEEGEKIVGKMKEIGAKVIME